jgi:hypothetical protein
MDGKSPQEKLEMVQYLHGETVKGPWHDFYLRVLETRELIRVRKAADAIIKGAIASAADAATAQLDHIGDLNARAARRVVISQWVKDRTAELAGDAPIRDAAGDSEMDMMTDVNRQEITRLQTLLDAIRGHHF